MRQIIIRALGWSVVLLVLAVLIGLLAWAALLIWRQVGLLWLG